MKFMPEPVNLYEYHLQKPSMTKTLPALLRLRRNGNPLNAETNTRRFSAPIAFVVTATAAILRFHRLGGQSIWNDEIFTWRAVILPLQEIQPHLHGVHPPLFFYLTHLTVLLFGTDEWQLRLISAIAGTLTIGIVHYLGSKYLGSPAGLLAALLLMISPLHLAYSQEARPYALAGLCCVVSAGTFLQLLEQQSFKRAAVFILASLALLYAHHWGIFMLLAEGGYLVLFQRRLIAGEWKYFLLIALSILLGYMPEIPALLPHHRSLGTEHWFWVEPPGIMQLFKAADAYGGGYFKMATATFGEPNIAGILGGVAIMAVFIAALFRNAKSSGGGPGRVLLTLFTFGLGFPFVVSFFRPEIFLWYRYPVVFLPLFCILAGSCLTDPRLRRGILLPLAVITLIGVKGTYQYFHWEKANVRSAVTFLNDVSRQNIRFIVRPEFEKDVIGYYYSGDKPCIDETGLDGPLGAALDSTKIFAMVTLDIPDPARDEIGKRFTLTDQRIFPGEEHMGLVVGVYGRKAEAGNQ